MVGFIVMVDEFRRDNDATRFVPGSHRWPHAPSDKMPDATADYEGHVSACGPSPVSRWLPRGSRPHTQTSELV